MHGPSWRRFIIGFALTVACTGWPAYLELKDDIAELASNRKVECKLEQEEAPQSFSFHSLYQEMFAIRRMHPATDQVREILIGSGIPEVQANPCVGRVYMANLLDELAKLHPAAVAIDKYYLPHSCSETAGTLALQASVLRFPAPLIVGKDSALAETDDRYSCLCQADNLPLTGPQVRPGILRLNEQALEIPLRWNIRTEDKVGAQPLLQQESYGLAFAAAIAVQPRLEKKLWRQVQRERLEDPYADLRDGGEIENQSSDEFLCDVNPVITRARWHLACGARTKPLDVNGKVVVLGTRDPIDVKPLLGESIFGVDLQARYVAALLSGAYLHQWMLIVELLVAVFLLAVTEGVVLWFDIDKRISFGHRGSRPRHAIRLIEGMPVIAFVAFMCTGVMIAGLVSLYCGFLPPIGLMATAVLLLLNDFRQYVLLKWRAAGEGAC